MEIRSDRISDGKSDGLFGSEFYFLIGNFYRILSYPIGILGWEATARLRVDSHHLDSGGTSDSIQTLLSSPCSLSTRNVSSMGSPLQGEPCLFSLGHLDATGEDHSLGKLKLNSKSNLCSDKSCLRGIKYV